MTKLIRLATRGSLLALWQANHVADLLRDADSGIQIELVHIDTAGDQDRDKALSQIGGDGLFTKEIQRAVLENRADVTVHSLKDLPTIEAQGLILAAVPPRGATGDALVSTKYRSFDALPQGSLVATGSPRRRSQLLHRRPDLRIVEIRGNVETRLRKLSEQNIDALVLAQAGLDRLGLAGVITEVLDDQWMLPAVGQGALGLECRADDTATRELLTRLDHSPTSLSVRAERAMLRGLGGGCQVPIGAATIIEGESLVLRGVVLSPEGRQRIDGQIRGSLSDCESLGGRLAEQLLSRGARALLTT